MTASAGAGSPVMASAGTASSRLRLRAYVWTAIHACMQVSALSELLNVPPRAAMLAAFKHILASPMRAPHQLPAQQPSTSGQAPPHIKSIDAVSAATAQRPSEGQGPAAACGDAAGAAAQVDPDLARALERLAVGDLPGEPFADEEGMAVAPQAAWFGISQTASAAALCSSAHLLSARCTKGLQRHACMHARAQVHYRLTS